MRAMKKIIEGFEQSMTAAAFAEANETETARAIMREGKSSEQVKKKQARNSGPSANPPAMAGKGAM